MEHYVTLFDSLFFSQGLALHMSMERHAGDYTLWILCMDMEAHDGLVRLELPNVRLLNAKALETPELLAVKNGRTRAEYCWTMTPFALRFVLEADATVSRVTYLDADLWFRRHPALLFRELDESKKQVLITDHAYAPEYDQSVTSGLYCVQFVTFVRGSDGERVRNWWEKRCIEWCFAYLEDGKFGDQKYLDDWPERFGEFVHVLENKELALAPWNATRFPFGNAVFYHFHELRMFSKRGANTGAYQLPKPLIEHVYKPYSQDLRTAVTMLEEARVSFRPQAKPVGVLRKTYRRLVRAYHTMAPTETIRW